MDPRWDSKHRHMFLNTVDNPRSSLRNDNHRSLKTKILSLHGGDSWEEICYLERTRMKIERRAAEFSPSSNSSFHCPEDGSSLGFETSTNVS